MTGTADAKDALQRELQQVIEREAAVDGAADEDIDEAQGAPDDDAG